LNAAAGGRYAVAMYTLDSVRPAAEELIRAIGRRLGVEGATNTWPDDYHASYRWPDLVLGQTCGLPFVEALEGSVGLVGAFTYTGVSTGPGRYRSRIVATRSSTLADHVGGRAVINGYDSLSGWASLGSAMSRTGVEGPVFSNVAVSGGHVVSLEVLRRGEADLAAIDAVTWALVARDRPDLVDGLYPIDDGPEVGCLPLITAFGGRVGELREAITGALADLAGSSVLERLLIDGFVAHEASVYAPVRDLARVANRLIPRP
jgi:ABC-type phosphate/phosphonate transport system substrate-binding protein